MKGYIGSNIDKEKLFIRLPSLLNGREVFRGCIEAQVGAFNRAVLVTSQRIIHIMPDDYVFVDAFPRYSITSHERHTDSRLHRIEVKLLKTSHSYASANTVDMMWMQRTLEEKPEPVSEEEQEGSLDVRARHKRIVEASPLRTDGVDRRTSRGSNRGDESRKRKLKECKTCGKAVASFASTCPHCGEKNPTVTTKDTLVGLGVLVVLAVAISLLFGGNEDDEYYRNADGVQNSRDSGEFVASDDADVHGAWAYMQLFVEERLKSPSSADFPFGGYRHVTPLGHGRYRVKSYVDSQNSYGATIHTHFEGVIRSIDGGWQLEYLNLN